ncbi:MAG: hypothetical protein JO161_04505, partial [Planctomycetaceae bacterium]|nr:hypothetical protein [Planctomycetaceae bacterium]
IPLEDWFYKEFAPLAFDPENQDLVVMPEFYHVPCIEGFQGYQNRNYMTGKYRMIYHARATLQFFKNLVRPAP